MERDMGYGRCVIYFCRRYKKQMNNRMWRVEPNALRMYKKLIPSYWTTCGYFQPVRYAYKSNFSYSLLYQNFFHTLSMGGPTRLLVTTFRSDHTYMSSE